MSKLVSMKIDPKKREEKYAETVAADRPIYPWGLGINLDEEAIEKLGGDLPEVGTTMTVIARVDVTAVSSNESASGKNRSVSLQITDMCLEDDADEGGSAADKLYAGKK